jgi:hypothetical protein
VRAEYVYRRWFTVVMDTGEHIPFKWDQLGCYWNVGCTNNATGKLVKAKLLARSMY